MGRSGASEKNREALNALEEAAAEVVVAQADVSQADDVARVLTTLIMKEMEESMPPLRGIVHCAGVFDDRLLINHTWDLFEKVFAPKVNGSWNLHTLTVARDIPLDFFVLFSSAASMLGASGLGNYVAANAFLDTLAHYRRQQGLPALSINWGPWHQVGMATAVGNMLESQWESGAIVPMDPAQALQALEHLLQQQQTQAGVIQINWSKFFAAEGADQAKFWQAFKPRRAPISSPVRQQATFIQQLENVPASDRWDLLSAHVQTQVAKVMGLPPTEPLDPEQGFFEMGMDSMMSMELRSRLQKSLACSLPSTLTFKYPKLDALVSYLGQDILQLDSTYDQPLQKSPEQADIDPQSGDDMALQANLLSEVEELSEEELEQFISDKLDAFL